MNKNYPKTNIYVIDLLYLPIIYFDLNFWLVQGLTIAIFCAKQSLKSNFLCVECRCRCKITFSQRIVFCHATSKRFLKILIETSIN